ncbi:hypothetical protein MJO28_005317 [Puccinia striiformis f. sp. tritici]|uniref:Uncharacterized protein n=1 Tax=Puccinia striiformis f. sp. tritici TaxID=168172 RepID=A0ACC0EJQ9_9BASI|nr:hypothetical protein MJO28_005317 [Puccinia striiformis f. sp. tritici]
MDLDVLDNKRNKLNLNLMEMDPPHLQEARSFVKDLFDFSSADSYAYSASSEDTIGDIAGKAYDTRYLATESDEEPDRIGDEIDLLEGGNNLFSYKTLGSEFWKVDREAGGRSIWNQIEETLVLPDPGASLFVPGAKEHYYMEDAYELNLSSMESSSTGGSYIQWMCLESDEESLNYEIAALFSDDASIVWMGDSPSETYTRAKGKLGSHTTMWTSAGSSVILLSTPVLAISTWISGNVRLANGQIEKVGWSGIVRICINNYEMDLEAYLINLPDIDLHLGLPWLVKTRAVPEYDDMSYTFWDDIVKVATLATLNKWRIQSVELNLHDIDTGSWAAVRIGGRPYSPPEHKLIEKFVVEGLRDVLSESQNHPGPPHGSDDAYQFLQGAKKNSSIDLKSGFWQVKLTERPIEKTAFGARNGAYEFLVMPLGLCNAPATFQSMMNSILRECLENDLVVSEKKCEW